jgi:hypothetical protein
MKSPFYTLALFLAIIAFFVEAASFGTWSQYSIHLSRDIETALRQHTQTVRNMETVHLARVGKILDTIALTLIFSGFSSMVVSIVRREKGWHLILLGIFFMDFIYFLFC